MIFNIGDTIIYMSGKNLKDNYKSVYELTILGNMPTFESMKLSKILLTEKHSKNRIVKTVLCSRSGLVLNCDK